MDWNFTYVLLTIVTQWRHCGHFPILFSPFTLGKNTKPKVQEVAMWSWAVGHTEQIVRAISMIAFIWFIFMFSGCPSRTVAYLHIVGHEPERRHCVVWWHILACCLTHVFDLPASQKPVIVLRISMVASPVFLPIFLMMEATDLESSKNGWSWARVSF